MKQTFTGVVISSKITKTAVVNVVFKRPHPIYKKLTKKDRKLKADTGERSVKVGQKVKIESSRPISKDKHFKIVEVIENGSD